MLKKEIIPSPNAKGEIVADPELEHYLGVINELDEKDQISNARCKFCKSENRHEGEMEYERCKNFKVVLDFMNHKDGENAYNYNNIRIHIRSHYLKSEQMIQRQNYGKHIAEVMKHKFHKMKRVESMVAMLEDKAWKYAAIADNEDWIKSLKNDDMFLKVVKEMANLLQIQAQLEGEMKPVQIIIERFEQIIVSAIDEISDSKKKMSILKELEKLKEANILPEV